jgi:predicted transcriptional regulator
METAVMARKKTPPPRPGKEKAATIAVTLRGSPEWKTWLEKLARHSRLDVAKVIDRALIDFAEKEGFDEEAPER